MFNSQSGVAPTPETTPPTGIPTSSASENGSDAIYVMPEKYHSPVMKSSAKGLIIALIVLVAVILASLGYLLYNMEINNAKQAENNNQAIDVTTTTPDLNLVESTSTVATSTEATTTEATATSTVEVATTTVATTTTAITEVTVSVDTDKDGLTDLEEGVIGTNPLQPDSNGNGYVDGKEITNGYNPVTPVGAKLSAAPFIQQINTTFSEDNFSILSIKNWQNSIGDEKDVTISIPTGESIKIAVKSNPEKLTATNYFLTNNPDVLLSTLRNAKFNGLSGVIAPDGLSAYFTNANNSKIYSFVYSLNGNTEIRYPSIFSMIVANFKLATSTAVK